MNKFHKMYGRANLQTVGQFIQYEGTATAPDCMDFEEREDIAVGKLKEKLKGHISGQEYVKVFDAATEYAGECAEIYFSVGMKIGARLMFQLLSNNMNDVF